jgi:acyl carrier protein
MWMSETPGTVGELASMLVEVLNLPGVTPDQIAPDAPLFGDGLGLDSIDVLEIAVALSQRYGIQLRADDDATRSAFASLRSLAAYVDQHRASSAAT